MAPCPDPLMSNSPKSHSDGIQCLDSAGEEGLVPESTAGHSTEVDIAQASSNHVSLSWLLVWGRFTEVSHLCTLYSIKRD